MVTTSVITTGVGSEVGSGVEVLIGSLIMPSHSSPPSESSVVSGVSSVGVSSVGVAGVSEAIGDSSAKTGEEMVEIAKTLTEPTSKRVKNNLTKLLIISNYTTLCVKMQEVV